MVNRNSGGFFNEGGSTPGDDTATFFATTTDDGHIAILSDGSTPSLNAGITAAAVRELLEISGLLSIQENGTEVLENTTTIDIRGNGVTVTGDSTTGTATITITDAISDSSVQIFFEAVFDAMGAVIEVRAPSIALAPTHTHYSVAQSNNTEFFTNGDITTLQGGRFGRAIETQNYPFTPLVPGWLPLTDPNYLENSSVPIFFRRTEDPVEVLEPSTRLDQEILAGATEFTPTTAPHTHYSTVELNNTRYFPDGTLTSFDLNFAQKAHFDGDILRDDITYTPLVPDWLPLTDPNYVDAAGAQAALNISDNGTTLTYTDAAGMVQTYTPAVPESGIQRLLTNLPDRSYLPNDDPTTEYWVRIDTATAIPRDISLQVAGVTLTVADNALTKVGATNLHLGLGDNVFTFRFTAAEVVNWNSSRSSFSGGSPGFTVLDNGTQILSQSSDNQFFLGEDFQDVGLVEWVPNASYEIGQTFYTGVNTTTYPVDTTRSRLYRVTTAIDATHATFDAVVRASVALIGDGTGTGGNAISVESGGTQIDDDVRIINFASGITAVQNALDNTRVDISVADAGITQVATLADLPVDGSLERLALVEATNELYRWDASLDTPAWVILDVHYLSGPGITVDNGTETITVRLANANSRLSFDSTGGLRADVPVVNDNAITITGEGGLTGSGVFTLNQDMDQHITLDLDTGNVDSATLDSTGLLTLGRHNQSNLTINAPAITFNGGNPALADDVTAEEIRTLIGAGTGGGGSDVQVNEVSVDFPNFTANTANRGITYTITGTSPANITAVAGADNTKQDNLTTSQLAVINAQPFTTADETRLDNANISSLIAATNPVFTDRFATARTPQSTDTLLEGVTLPDGINYRLAGDVATLNDIGNVTITTPINLDVLEYNGTAWVNRPLQSANINLTETTTTIAASDNRVRITGGNAANPIDFIAFDVPAASVTVDAVRDIALYRASTQVTFTVRAMNFNNNPTIVLDQESGTGNASLLSGSGTTRFVQATGLDTQTVNSFSFRITVSDGDTQILQQTETVNIQDQRDVEFPAIANFDIAGPIDLSINMLQQNGAQIATAGIDYTLGGITLRNLDNPFTVPRNRLVSGNNAISADVRDNRAPTRTYTPTGNIPAYRAFFFFAAATTPASSAAFPAADASTVEFGAGQVITATETGENTYYLAYPDDGGVFQYRVVGGSTLTVPEAVAGTFIRNGVDYQVFRFRNLASGTGFNVQTI